MKRILVSILGLLILQFISGAQLVTYPGLPNNKLKSGDYTVRVKLSGGSYVNSYVYEYMKNVGTNATTSDPYNIANAAKRDALTNSNHWTTFSFGGNSVVVEITKTSGSISHCDVLPARYNLSATYANGKAYITIPSASKKIYVEVDGNIEEPLFLFADPLETNVPSSSDPTVEYYGPGIHNIGVNHTPASGITTVYVAGGAYVQGNIYTNNRSNLTIRGRGVISGEGIAFNVNNRVDAHIFFEGSTSGCKIEGITIMKPIHYHVLSRGQYDVDNIKCFSWNNTTDGWGGGYGSANPSTCTNSFFKVNDDVFKLYGDNYTITDNVVYHQTNGHIIQFGWGGQSSRNSTVSRVDIVRTSETEPTYPASEGHPIVGWASANTGTYQTGHVFDDFTAVNGMSRLFDIDAGGSNIFTCSNWDIASTRMQSVIPSNADIDLTCVYVDGSCVTSAEFDNPGAVTINCSSCGAIDDPPAAPTGVSATAGDGFVTLTWNANTEDDFSRYAIFKGTSSTSLSWYQGSITQTQFTDNSVTNGTTYYYAVQAIDDAGNRSLSATVSATPGAEPEYFFIYNQESKLKIRPETGDEGSFVANAPFEWTGDWTHWQKITTSGEYFYLKNKKKGQYLSMPNTADHAEIVATFTPDEASEWKTVAITGTTYFHLENKASGKRIRSRSTDDMLNLPAGNIYNEVSPLGWTGSWVRWEFVDLSSPKAAREENSNELSEPVSQFVVYPNPAQGVFTIENAVAESNMVINIYNIQGRLVYQSVTDAMAITIQTSELGSTGLYLVQIQSQGETSVHKLRVE